MRGSTAAVCTRIETRRRFWIAADRGRLVLRALMPGHSLAGKLKPGAELVRINGRPAKIVHQEICRKIREWSGWSSQHFLDARLSFQFFHFDKNSLPLAFLNPDGSLEEVKLPKWGPGGRPLSRKALTLPEGLEARGSAVSAKLSDKVNVQDAPSGSPQPTGGCKTPVIR